MTLLGLETRQTNAISNWYDATTPSLQDAQLAAKLEATYVTAKPRPTKVCYTYNCHGLTFASRRTQITSSSEVRKILTQDGYKKIVLADVMTGDIVIYVTSEGEIDHSGIVVDVPNLPGLIVRNPKILSKWGSAHEFIHHVGDCPYSSGTHTEYYRLEK